MTADRSTQRPDDDSAAAPILPHMPTRKASCSEAGYRFQLQHIRIFEFFFFSIELSTRADKVRFTASEALAVRGTEKDIARFMKVQQNPQPTFRKLQSFSSYQSEIMVIRLVDNFTCFLSEILQACMLKKPQILRSKEQINTEDVLRFTNRRDLLDFLVNKKINQLSYGGLKVIEEFLAKRLGIPLIANDDERTTIGVAIELRNIYTHSRGVVNELFLSRIATHKHNFSFAQGKRFHAEYPEILSFANTLYDVAIRLDTRAIKKFSIQKKRYGTWDAPRLSQLRDASDNARAPGDTTSKVESCTDAPTHTESA